jgi:MFS family permease
MSCLVWGAITIATAFTKNYGQLIGIRVLLGLFEAGLFPCISVYIFMTYRREETGRRMAYIYVCLVSLPTRRREYISDWHQALSGAFGGLIAYGLIRIQTGGLDGWQWLYIVSNRLSEPGVSLMGQVEGIISVATAPVAFFWIPNRVDRAWFLNAEQKVHASKRMQSNKDHYNPNEEFTWREVGRGLKDWKVGTGGKAKKGER